MYFWLPAILFLLKFRRVDGQQEKEERVQVRLSTGVVEGRVVTFGDKKAYAFMASFCWERLVLELNNFSTLTSLTQNFPGRSIR